MTVILDYGMGNLRSVEKAVQFLGYDATVKGDLQGADRLIIPGVGAFGAAMERIGPLRDELRAFAASGAPVLGICLGQQLLFDRSEEIGEHSGLGIIPGEVVYLPRDAGLKIPHIGWSALTPLADEPLMSGVASGDQVYFVHSLYTRCEDASDVIATAEYGVTFPAAVRHGNVWGCQFHPEKSGDIGLQILRNFLSC